MLDFFARTARSTTILRRRLRVCQTALPNAIRGPRRVPARLLPPRALRSSRAVKCTRVDSKRDFPVQHDTFAHFELPVRRTSTRTASQAPAVPFTVTTT